MNFDKEAKSDKKNFVEGGGGDTETKTVCQTVSNEVNTKMQLSTQCRACGTINISKYVNIFFKHKPYNFYIDINISKYVNIFLSTNPTTFILSSLVSEFCQRI